MSHIATSAEMHAEARAEYAQFDLTEANIGAPANARALSMLFLGIGAIAVLVTIVGGFVVGGPAGLKHALAAYHIGVMSALAICLGSLFWVLAFHLTQAGWCTSIRRQFENVMSLTPAIALLVLPTLLIEMLFSRAPEWHLLPWMSKEVLQEDALLQAKSAFLNPVFFMIRAVIYLGVWSYLARRLYRYSTEQDRTGDKWLTNRARFTSAWGMLAFALTVAFASFDWLMSMDYRFFSTMWGVYFFAGAAYSSIPVVVLVLAYLRGQNKLRGLATAEHAHDLGKLMFGFTVFWAYIGFSQYFLIWYANVPEETQFMLVRKTGAWNSLSTFLVVGHFILPFFIMLWLFVRRTWRLLAVMAVWAVLMQIVDIYWIVRPFVYGREMGAYVAQVEGADPFRLGLVWLDAVGVLGPMGILFGLIFRRVGSGVLIPINDPRLPEAVHHRNYV